MASLLLNVGNSFLMNFKTVGGLNFKGQMLDIPDTSRVSNFLSARRYLRTKPNTPIKPADVVIIDKLKYIVADHGTGFHHGPIYKHFKLFEVDQEVAWLTKSGDRDVLTGVNKVTRNPAGNVYLSTQPKNLIQDEIHIPQETFIALCNKEVQRDDQVGNWIVTKVDYVLGIYALELKEI